MMHRNTPPRTITRWVMPLVALAITAGTAHAAVMVTGSTTVADQGTISGGATIGSFGLSGGNTIVALVSLEVPHINATLSATYNGLAMTQVGTKQTSGTTSSGSGQYAAVFYLINPGVGNGSMDLIVTPSSPNFGTADTLAVTAVSLGNVLGVSDTGIGTETSGSGTEVFTDVVTGGLSVAAYIDNSNHATSTPTIGTSAILDMVFSAQGGSFDGGSAGYLHGWGSVDTTALNVQDQALQASLGTSSTREAMALVSFTPVVIPAPAALPAGLAMFGLAIARRRRRR